MKPGTQRAVAPPWVHGAGAIATAGYLALALGADRGSTPLVALAVAHGLGWAALAIAWWVTRGAGGGAVAVWAWAVGFRLVGLGVEPAWEDDHHRYLWDGYQTLRTGNPYAEAPVAFFDDASVSEAMQSRLDGINHPDWPTIYGPVAQATFAVAAGVAPGDLRVLKLLWLAVELGGWWVLWRWLPPAGRLLALWCPLAVIEIGFAAHPEALVVGALAAALAAAARGRSAWACGWLGVAIATKGVVWIVAPFFVARAGWRGAGALGVVVAGCYAPWWLQGSAAEWPAVRAMGASFEYNSTGFAVVQWLVGPAAARAVAGGLIALGVGGLWLRWWREGRPERLPGAAVFGWLWLWSPVVNPWYLLWALPFVALQPVGWAVAAMAVGPLAYAHGLNLPGRAATGYQHPWWVRPGEAAVVAGAVAAGWWRRRRGR